MEKIHKLLQSPDNSDVEIGIMLLLKEPGRIFNRYMKKLYKSLDIKDKLYRSCFIAVGQESKFIMYRKEWLFDKIMEHTTTYNFLFFKVYRPKKQQL